MTASAPAARKSRYGSLLGHNRDFQLLWIGLATSELGSAVSGVAIPLLVLRLTGSTVDGGMAGSVAFVATWLFAIPGGYLSDRFSPRSTMVTADVLRGLLAGVVALVAVRGHVGVWPILGCVALANCASMAFGPAESHALRVIAPRDELPEAMAASQVRGYASALAGPALGGTLDRKSVGRERV